MFGLFKSRQPAPAPEPQHHDYKRYVPPHRAVRSTFTIPVPGDVVIDRRGAFDVLSDGTHRLRPSR